MLSGIEAVNACRDVYEKAKFDEENSIDLYTASAVVQVFDKLSVRNKRSFLEYSLFGMAEISFKIMKEARCYG